MAGLLALMLLTDARRAARTQPDGSLVPLAEQDRAKWDREQIAEGTALLTEALPRGAAGPYQLQAAIAAVHDEAASMADTDWPQILALYRLLEALAPNPFTTLNRAVAVGTVEGPEAGLRVLDALAADKRMARHHRLLAARAHLQELAGQTQAAAEDYLLAARHATSLPERRYLAAQAARLQQPGFQAGRYGAGRPRLVPGDRRDGTPGPDRLRRRLRVGGAVLLAVDRARPAWCLHHRAACRAAEVDGHETGLSDQSRDNLLGLGVVAAQPLDDLLLTGPSGRLRLEGGGEGVERLGVPGTGHAARVEVRRGLPAAGNGGPPNWLVVSITILPDREPACSIACGKVLHGTEITTTSPKPAAWAGLPVVALGPISAASRSSD